MRILLVWPGHSSSTWDIANCYRNAFKKLGVQVANFNYHSELLFANAGLGALRGKPEATYEGESILLASRMLMGYVAQARPDAVVVVTGLALYKALWSWLRDFKAALKHPYRVVGIFTESPYRPSEELEVATWCDLVFSNERAFVPRLRQFQPRSWYLPQAYSEDFHTPGEAAPRHDVYMCGSGFRDRIRILEGVDWQQAGATLTLRGLWPDVGATSPLAPYYQEGLVPNTEVVQAYRASKICLNLHRTEGEIVAYERDLPNAYYAVERQSFRVSAAYSMNNRTCEIAACRGFQLVDDAREEVAEVFGESVPRFGLHDAGALQELIAYYAHRPAARAKLAAEAYRRIQGRTYLANAKQILKRLEAQAWQQ